MLNTNQLMKHTILDVILEQTVSDRVGGALP